MPSHQDDNYEDRLQAALKELSLQPKLSLPLTARRFDVAERTLHDRKNGGRQQCQKAHLHECLLNPYQEQALVQWICVQDDRGISPRLDLVRDKVLAIIQQSQPKTSLGLSSIILSFKSSTASAWSGREVLLVTPEYWSITSSCFIRR